MSKLDYRGPDEPGPPKRMDEAVAGGLIGAGSLGCLVPLLLAAYCALVLNDMGGPLIWPIFVVVGGLAGLIFGCFVGAIVRVVRNHRRGGM